MNHIRLIPLAAPVLVFTAGILLCAAFPPRFPVYIQLGALITGVVFLIVFQWNKRVFSVIALPVFMVLGYLYSGIQLDESYEHAFHSRENEPDTLLVRITEPPEKTENSVKTFGEIEQMKVKGKWQHVKGNVLLYLSKELHKPETGDLCVVRSYVHPVEPPKNPDEFDYQSYLAQRGVHYSSFVSRGDFGIVPGEQKFSIRRYAHKARSFLLSKLKRHFHRDDDFAVASALLLGYKNNLSNETRSSFARAGAMHVLAVSGLHVGIIYGIVRLLFRVVPFFKYRKRTEGVVILLSLWGYAFITGLSPSVIRAATMFSFMVVAFMWRRRSNIYNTIAASALAVFLIFGPFRILEVGLQLSYIAVFGIVFFQPKLASVMNPPGKVLRYFWEIICVSVAAQLVTAPLAVYHFGVFPNYFLVTNLVVIPAAFVVLSTGMAASVLEIVTTAFAYFWNPGFTAAAWSQAGASFLGTALSFEAFGLNRAITVIQELPFSSVQNIQLQLPDVLLLYAGILSLAVWLAFRVKVAVFSMLVTVVLLLLGQNLKNLPSFNEPQAYIHAVDGHSVLSARGPDRELFLADSGFFKEEDLHGFYFGKTVSDHNAEVSISGSDRNPIICNGQVIYEINGEADFVPVRFDVDVLWVRNTADPDLERLTDLNPDVIVLDGSVDYYQRRRWKERCEREKLNVYDVPEEGAFAINTGD